MINRSLRRTEVDYPVVDSAHHPSDETIRDNDFTKTHAESDISVRLSQRPSQDSLGRECALSYLDMLSPAEHRFLSLQAKEEITRRE